MLSRTADHLYWMSRFIERAESLARMLDAHYRHSLLPHAPEDFLLDFYNATARDQQVEGYLRGDEDVSL